MRDSENQAISGILLKTSLLEDTDSIKNQLTGEHDSQETAEFSKEK